MILGLGQFIYSLQQYGRCSFSQERGTWRWSVTAGMGAKAPSVIWFRRLLKEWKLRNIVRHYSLLLILRC